MCSSLVRSKALGEGMGESRRRIRTITAGHIVIQIDGGAGHHAIRVGDLGDEEEVVEDNPPGVAVEHGGGVSLSLEFDTLSSSELDSIKKVTGDIYIYVRTI